MNRSISFLFLSMLFFLACGNPPADTNSKGNAAPQTTPTTPAKPTPNGPVVLTDAHLPSIPMTKLQHLWNNCNQMDYIFYELPISSSVNDAPSAQAHLRHISDTPVRSKEKERCGKAIGRIFYKSNGEDLIDAEVYFSGGCAFFIFYEKGKAKYSNLMTPTGSDHFNQIIAAATKGRPGQ